MNDLQLTLKPDEFCESLLMFDGGADSDIKKVWLASFGVEN